VLNANDYFRNLTGQPRPDLKQNQFGFAVGGPIRHNRLYYFGSYQGTRQTNGFAAGQARIVCSAAVVMPPLTNDRSQMALGALFGGMSGALGGIAIDRNGSNINPVALNLLNFKLPDGSFLIPTPQVINHSLPFSSQGFSTLSAPCHFSADQVLANVDANLPHDSSLAFRFMWSDSSMNVSFPGNGIIGTGNIPGFPSNIDNRFRVFSASWTRLLQTQLLNQLRFGYTNTFGSSSAQAPFQWSDIGVSATSLNNMNGIPSLAIVGSINMASAFPRTFSQERFYLYDILTYSRSRHMIQIGGSLSRIHDDINIIGAGSATEFLSWPDFLLGLSAAQNGSLFSNVFASIDNFGLLNREYRSWNASLFAGDHFRVTDTFTLDFGLRYERIGQYADALGRNSSFEINHADPNPPPSGSVAGYVVGANYQFSVPSGVIRAGNDASNLGKGQNGLAPRIGLAWQPFRRTSRFIVRAGYGIFYSQPTGQFFFQSVLGPPFSITDLNTGLPNSAATFAHPFPEPFPTASLFPLFRPYSPTSDIGIITMSPSLRPAIVQQYGLNFQAELAQGWLLEVGYFGSRGTHLLRLRSVDQALSASPANPIRGVESNTLENIGMRVPIPGFAPDSLDFGESEGNSLYNGLEISLTKKLSRGLQMLASYTFSKTLDTDGSNVNGIGAGNTLTLGDQNSPAQRRGRASFDRTHRFVLSAVYDFPSPSEGLKRALLGGWSSSGVLTIQSGTALTIAYNNSTNVFGISEDRAQLAPACGKSDLVRPGSIQRKVNEYFDPSCFTTPPVIGADGVGTTFGDSGTGIAIGPGQLNVDIGVMKSVPLSWPKEGSALQFRAEFFNAMNHPQFSNPNTLFGSPSFGIISSTSVNPRVVQLALKLLF
jgi:hypothetical protein